MFLYKKRKYYMNTRDADSTLKNILAACDMPPHTIPVDKLLLRQKLSTAPYSICMKIVLVQLIMLIVFPILLLLF